MTVQNTETQMRILAVKDDDWKYSIDADIPALGNKPFRFMTWRKQQGPPPVQGADVWGTLEPYRRSAYWIRQGKLAEAPVDGSEDAFMLDYNLLAVRPVEAGAVTEQGSTTEPTRNAPQNGLQDATAGVSTVLLDANKRYRLDNQLKNARDAIWMTLQHGAVGKEANLYADMEQVLAESKPIAQYLDRVLAEGLGEHSPLVQTAIDAGAVVTEVFDSKAEIQKLRSKPQLAEYVKKMGWSKDDISLVLDKAGYQDSNAFLKVEGNDVQELAFLLHNYFMDIEEEPNW